MPLELPYLWIHQPPQSNCRMRGGDGYGVKPTRIVSDLICMGMGIIEPFHIYVVNLLSRTVFDICCYQVEILLCLKKSNSTVSMLICDVDIWWHLDIFYVEVYVTKQFGPCSYNRSPYVEDLLYTCKTGYIFYHGWAKSQLMRADFTYNAFSHRLGSCTTMTGADY